MGVFFACLLWAVPSGLAERTPHRFQAHLMGTVFHITIADEISAAAAQTAAGQAFTEVARIEAFASEWRPDSPVSAINRAAGLHPVAISTELMGLLVRAQRLAAESRGAFDVTWAALRGLWSLDKTAPRVPEAKTLAAALDRVDYRRLRLDTLANTAFLERPGMAIGLGSIAKGYGVDRALAALKAAGIEHALVDGGGDMAVMGRPTASRPWSVGVQHPRRKGYLATVELTGGAVVTSGDYERAIEVDGTRYHHLLDLRTGQPARGAVAVTVRAPEATLADALATAAFVLGPREALILAKRYPRVDIALFTPDGRVVTTPGFGTLFPPRWDGR